VTNHIVNLILHQLRLSNRLQLMLYMVQQTTGQQASLISYHIWIIKLLRFIYHTNFLIFQQQI